MCRKCSKRRNKMKVQKNIIMLFVLVSSYVYCQDVTCYDTIQKDEKYTITRCFDEHGREFFRVHEPACFSIGLDRVPGADVGPIISICMPYNEWEWSDCNPDSFPFDVSCIYRFVDNQYMMILVDTNIEHPRNRDLDPFTLEIIGYLFNLDSILSEDDLSFFFEEVYCDLTEIYGGIPENSGLEELFEKTPRNQVDRVSMAVRGKYSQILLFNIKKENLEDFIESAKDMRLFVLKRIQ